MKTLLSVLLTLTIGWMPAARGQQTRQPDGTRRALDPAQIGSVAGPWQQSIPLAANISRSLPKGDPLKHGFTTNDLEELRSIIRNAVENGPLKVGASFLLAHRGQIIFQEAFGNIKVNSQIRLASSTKPLTAATIAILVDQGRLSLEDPLEKYLPEFKDVKLQGSARPSKPPTVRDVISNASGISGIYTPEMNRPDQTLAHSVRLTAARGLLVDPKTQYNYSGVAFGVAARVAEVVMGKPFEEIMREQLLKPLGINNTRFGLPETPRGFRSDEPGAGPFIMGGGGLLSTLDDTAIFYEMLRNRGEYGGKRILSVKMAEEMRRSQIKVKGGNGPGADGNWGQDYGFGLFLQNPDSYGVFQRFEHSGAFGTVPWGDEQRQLVAVFVSQDNLRNGAPVARRLEQKINAVILEHR